MIDRTGAVPASEIRPPMAQSEKGKKVSRTTLEMAGTTNDEAKRATILNYGIDEIVKSSETTPDEKAFVALLSSMNPNSVGVSNLDAARTLTLKALTETMSVPLSTALAKVVLDVSDPVQNSAHKKNLLWYGLDTLKKQQGLPDKEKALVGFVLDMNEQSVNTAPMIAARERTLKAIASQEPGPAKAVIADVVLDVEKTVQNTGNANNLLWYGLNAIQHSTCLTDKEKALLDMGQGMNAQSAGPLNHEVRLAGTLILDLVSGAKSIPLFCLDFRDLEALRDITWYGHRFPGFFKLLEMCR